MKQLYNKINEKLFIDTEDISSEIDLLPIKVWIKNYMHINDKNIDNCLSIENNEIIFNVDELTVPLSFFMIYSCPPENLIFKSDNAKSIKLENLQFNKNVCKILNNAFKYMDIFNLIFNGEGEISGLNVNVDAVSFIIGSKKIRIKNNIFNKNKNINVDIKLYYDGQLSNLLEFSNNKNINYLSFDYSYSDDERDEINKSMTSGFNIIKIEKTDERVNIPIVDKKYPCYIFVNKDIQEYINKNILSKVDCKPTNIIIRGAFKQGVPVLLRNKKIPSSILLYGISCIIYHNDKWILAM